MIGVRKKKWIEKYLRIKINPKTELQDLIYLLAKKIAKLENYNIKIDKDRIQVVHGGPDSEQLSNPMMPGKGGE